MCIRDSTYLPQENSVFRTLTVEENIQAILELQTNEDGSPFTKWQGNTDWTAGFECSLL